MDGQEQTAGQQAKRKGSDDARRRAERILERNRRIVAGEPLPPDAGGAEPPLELNRDTGTPPGSDGIVRGDHSND